jgi:hypothetical protein
MVDTNGTTSPPGVGDRVEVRTRFDRRWSRGFEVAEVTEAGNFVLRRLSDGDLLPIEFKADEVRAERHRSMWWL